MVHPEQAHELRTAYGDNLDAMLKSAGVELFSNARIDAGTAYALQAGQVGTVGFESPLAKQAAEADGGKPSDIAAAAKRAGFEVTDSDTYTRLVAEATEGRRLKAAAAKAKVEASVDDAISKGKITPARKKHWVILISADPGMGEVLASVPNETAVPLSEVGHGQTGGDDLVESAEWFR